MGFQEKEKKEALLSESSSLLCVFKRNNRGQGHNPFCFKEAKKELKLLHFFSH